MSFEVYYWMMSFVHLPEHCLTVKSNRLRLAASIDYQLHEYTFLVWFLDAWWLEEMKRVHKTHVKWIETAQQRRACSSNPHFTGNRERFATWKKVPGLSIAPSRIPPVRRRSLISFLWPTEPSQDKPFRHTSQIPHLVLGLCSSYVNCYGCTRFSIDCKRPFTTLQPKS